MFLMFQKTPASFRVNQLSAEIFEIQGKYSEAVAEFRKAIEKNRCGAQSALSAGKGVADGVTQCRLTRSGAPGV